MCKQIKIEYCYSRHCQPRIECVGHSLDLKNNIEK